MSAAKGKAFCDSIMGYSVPRIACALNLNTSPCYISVEETEEVSFNVFPNPANESFAIRASERVRAIRVFDAMGRVVYNSNTNNQEVVFVDSSNWSAGMYTVEIHTDNNVVARKKMLKN
jgi:hypothetical protein